MIPDVSNERFHQNGGTGGGEVAPPPQGWIPDVRGSNGYVQNRARFAIYVHDAPGVATVCNWKVGARAVPPKRRNRWRGGRSPAPRLDSGCPGVKWICSKSHIRTRCTRCSRGFVFGGRLFLRTEEQVAGRSLSRPGFGFWMSGGLMDMFKIRQICYICTRGTGGSTKTAEPVAGRSLVRPRFGFWMSGGQMDMFKKKLDLPYMYTVHPV